jgi:hypothetical protein
LEGVPGIESRLLAREWLVDGGGRASVTVNDAASLTVQGMAFCRDEAALVPVEKRTWVCLGAGSVGVVFTVAE